MFGYIFLMKLFKISYLKEYPWFRIGELGTISNQAAVMPAAKPGIHKVYVEADEDHVAMQKGHAKKMKLIKFFIFRMLFYNWFQRCKYFFYSLDKFWFMSILFLYPCEDRCYRGHGLLSFEAVQAALGHRNQLLWAEDLLFAECLPDSPPKGHWTHGESGKPSSQQPENATVSGRAFCKVPKRQSAGAAKPYKLANTAWNIFLHLGR